MPGVPCNWRPSSIQLYDNELTGSIPPELGNLQNLWGLTLSGNVLAGPIPSELGGLKNLGILDLSDNKLTGPVPREFGALQTLTHLDLSDNQLGGPLPRELVRLRLGHFFWDNTNPCAPTDDAFQQWLASITHHKGNRNCDS